MNTVQTYSPAVASKRIGWSKYSLSFGLLCIGAILIYTDFARSAFDQTGMVFQKQARAMSILAGPLFSDMENILVFLRNTW